MQRNILEFVTLWMETKIHQTALQRLIFIHKEINIHFWAIIVCFFILFYCTACCTRHSSVWCVFIFCDGMNCSSIFQPVSRICCPLAMATVIFLPYLSSRCWKAPCTGTAARGPQRLMHPGREKQPAVGHLMFKTSSPPSIHPCSAPSILFFFPPSTPQRKKAQAIKSAQMVKHLLGAFQCGQERLNSLWATIWGHFLGRGDLERDKGR